MRSIPVVVLAALVALAWAFLRRANELCVVRVADGRATLVRGRAPTRFLFDADDIARRSGGARFVVAVVTEGGVPRVIPRSDRVGDAELQQLRNAAGQHQVVHFRTGVRAS